MPTLKELSAEYDTLRSESEKEKTVLAELKPKITTLNHVKYNFDILTPDTLAESPELRRADHEGR